jgi:hypothetical protein
MRNEKSATRTEWPLELKIPRNGVRVNKRATSVELWPPQSVWVSASRRCRTRERIDDTEDFEPGGKGSSSKRPIFRLALNRSGSGRSSSSAHGSGQFRVCGRHCTGFRSVAATATSLESKLSSTPGGCTGFRSLAATGTVRHDAQGARGNWPGSALHGPRSPLRHLRADGLQRPWDAPVTCVHRCLFQQHQLA